MRFLSCQTLSALPLSSLPPSHPTRCRQSHSTSFVPLTHQAYQLTTRHRVLLPSCCSNHWPHPSNVNVLLRPSPPIFCISHELAHPVGLPIPGSTTLRKKLLTLPVQPIRPTRPATLGKCHLKTHTVGKNHCETAKIENLGWLQHCYI
jgi:hypothetical protein